jgi:hypothetical protein
VFFASSSAVARPGSSVSSCKFISSDCVSALASPPAKSEAAEEENYDHDDEDEYKHCLSVRAADHERRSAIGPNF